MSAIEARPGIWGALAGRIDLADEDDSEGGIDVWERIEDLTDPARFRPKLAPDIEIREFKGRWGNDHTMIANPRDLVHYRLEPGDAEMVKLMDGTRTVKDIVVQRFQESGDLELAGLADLVRELRSSNFLVTPFVDTDAAVKRALDPMPKARRKAREFVKTLRIDWDEADKLVQWMYHHGFKWFFNKVAVIASALLAAVGLVAFVFAVRSGNFSLTGKSLAIGFLILLGLDYFSVFIHELGHALVLTHNGRHIGSAGFMIYFGSPAFFVESADGMMMSKGQEILSSFAGPFGQMLVGGLCASIALLAPGWGLSQTLYRAAVLNYFMVFMNLLPLLELDGYFILSDAIEQPDLREKSLSFIQHGLWYKIRHRESLNKVETALALYGIIGIAFTIFSFYTSYFYWETVFGGFVSTLWRGGLVTRGLLVLLGLFVAGPLIRGAFNLARSLSRKARQLGRRVRFRLERTWRVEAAELIDGLPLFEDVPEDALSDLAGRVKLRSFSPGQPVVHQGERAQAFYVVRRGTLQVIEQDPKSGAERSLRVLGRGDAFGELGLKEARRRTATVRAMDEAEVFEVDKSTFDRLLADMLRVPEFAPSLQAVVELQEHPAFEYLEPDELSELLAHGAWINVAPGETIVEQGEVGNAFYAVGSGQVEVYEDDELSRTLGPGSYFGEIALLLDVPRTASVLAKTPARLFRLEREGFDRLIGDAFRGGRLNAHAAASRTSQH